MGARLNAPAADTARTISDLRAQIKAGRATSRQVADHPQLREGGRGGERLRLARRPEPAFPVERDRRLVLEKTQSERRAAPRARAQAATPSTSMAPTPWRRSVPSTNMPTSTGPDCFGSSG